MTLAKRIIPTLLCKGRTLFKGTQFNAWRSIGHVAQAMQVHGKRAVDEAILLDISATAEGRGPDLDLVRELTEEFWVPLTVGGGVRSLQDIDALLRAGADKVAIGTALFEVTGLLPEASARFGRQALVASLDVKGGKDGFLTSCCGKKEWNDVPVFMAQVLEDAGAGEILLSSVDRDGTMQGYDLGLIREVSQAVSIPVIASGGCSGYENMLEAFKAGADACAAGALFAFSDATPKGAARFLKSKGLEVRCA